MTKKMKILVAGLGAAQLLALQVMNANTGILPAKAEQLERGGQPLLAETYTLPLGADPSGLIKEPFDLDGVHYEYDITQTQEVQNHQEKQQEITVTVETESDDTQEILAALPVKEAYESDGFKGELLLDTATLKTEKAGTKEVGFSVSGTKTLTGLERNDPALVPQTMVKSGVTLKLKSVNWSVDGYSIDENNLGGGAYTATATYSGTGYKTVVTGYTTTARYSGTVTRTQPDHLDCMITYLGTPIQEPEPESESGPFPERTQVPLYAGIGVAGLGLLVMVSLLLRWWHTTTVRIYSAKRGEDDFRLVRRRHLSRRHPKIRLYEPTNADYAVVVKRRMCRKLIGRTITVSMEKCTVRQTVRSGERDLWIMLEPWKGQDDDDD